MEKVQSHGYVAPPFRLFAQSLPGADAGVRRQDWCDFEGWYRLDSFPDLQGDAAHAQAVSPQDHTHCQMKSREDVTMPGSRQRSS